MRATTPGNTQNAQTTACLLSWGLEAMRVLGGDRTAGLRNAVASYLWSQSSLDEELEMASQLS